MITEPLISDLSIISDQISCALADRQATIQWYCPERFDKDAVFSSLLDLDKGGFWSVSVEGKQLEKRAFIDRSSVLQYNFKTAEGDFTLTDFMPLGEQFRGICRLFSPSPLPVQNELKLRPGYGLEHEEYEVASPRSVYFNKTRLWLLCSHDVRITDDCLVFGIPENEKGWALLTDRQLSADVNPDNLLNCTLSEWAKLSAELKYDGPFKNEVEESILALQQMVYRPNGSILAAATTSLPEVYGGKRNYDYRFIWMRDSAIYTNALVQLDGSGKPEHDFLQFITEAMEKNAQPSVACLYTLTQEINATMYQLPLRGYGKSRPVNIGNDASDQFQLDSEGNILLTSHLVFKKYNERVHWPTVEKLAEFVCKNWHRKDNGIWEEKTLQHYTYGKIMAARGLEFISSYQTDKLIAERWLAVAAQIRDFVNDNCKTDSGAYAVYAGSQDVDISLALIPAWSYDDTSSAAMVATIDQIERDYASGNLYRRRLEEFDSDKEGAFLAGTCWMALYYSMDGKIEKSRQIIDALIESKNDLGYFSEEMDTRTGYALGNFPQTFVHASFISAIIAYRAAIAGRDSIAR